MTTKTDRPCLYFPNLVAAAAPSGLPEIVRFLDPGLGVPQDDDESRYVGPQDMPPEFLPMNAEQARRYLDAMLELGRSFRKPSDVAQLLAMDESLSLGPDLRAEFSALERFAAQEAGVAAQPGEGGTAADEDAARARAQRTLILARAGEEREYESGAISRALDDSVARFESSLGFDEEDEQERTAMGADKSMALAGAGRAMSRVAVLEALCTLFGAGLGTTVLVSASDEVRADFEELDISLEEAGSQRLATLCPGLEEWSGQADVCIAPIWRLIGRDRPSLRRPWLDREATLVLLGA